MSTEIKNTLFRFVTMRAPEIVSGEKKENHFVYHPDFKKEVISANTASFFKEQLLNPKSSIIEQLNALKTKATEFESSTAVISSKENLELLVGFAFLNFTDQFSKLKSSELKRVSASDLLQNHIPVALSAAVLNQLWDNLFYQILKQSNPSLRDAIMRVLITNHYIKNGLVEEAGLKLKASVVIPKVFMGDASSTNEIVQQKLGSQAPKNFKEKLEKLDEISAIDSARETLSTALKAKKELEAIEKKFRKEVTKKNESEQKAHKSAVKTAFENATLVTKEIVNTVTGETTFKKEYTDLVVPEFTPTVFPEIDPTNLEASVGVTTFRLIEEHKLTTCESFKEVYELLDQLIIETNEVLTNQLGSKSKTAFIAGVPVQVDESVLSRTGNEFVYKVSMKRDRYSLSMNQGMINPDGTTTGVDPLFYWSEIKITMNNLDASDIDIEESTISIDYFDSIEGSDKTVDLNLNTVVGNGNITIKRDSNFTVDIPADTQSVNFNAKLMLEDGTIEFIVPINLLPSNIGSTKTGTGVAYFTPFEVVPDPDGNTNPDGNTGDNGSNTSGNGTETGTETGTLPNSGDTTFIPSKFGVKSLGIADYRKVEQEVCCYEPGEVSHIENIMAREYKEKSTERSRTTDTTTTVSNERETENLTDTSTTTRNEMHSEVSQVLHQDMQMGMQTNFHWGGSNGPGGSINGSFAMGSAQDDSTLQAVTYAQDVTQRAMERVVAKLKNEKITKVIESYKENNKHGFDNTKGNQHVSGVYRWINKVYNNQLVNYGKRALVEFMIPEPSRFHVLASIKNNDQDVAVTIEKPVDPRSAEAGNNRIENFKDIAKIGTPNNYVHWSSLYGVEAEIAPSEFLTAGKSFTKSEQAGEYADVNKAMSADIDVPEGYYLDHASTSGTVWGQTCMLYIANKQVDYYTLAPVTFSERFTEKIPVSVYFDWVVGATVNVNLTFKRSDELYQSWQNRIFNDIIAAYEEKLEAYNRAVEDAKAKAEETYGSNPLFYRQIERNALKKNIMHYLVDSRYIGQDYITDDEDLEKVKPNNSETFDTNASVTRFMEQAFEWDIMSYSFLPFYWGSKARWKKAYNYDFNDALFTNFMQAGMARVILSVRPGFEKAVNWYMATGQVWNGGQVPTLGDDLFLSIDEELRDVQPTPGGLPWKTKLPSDLTVIQSSTIGLKAEGLPCGCPDTVGGEVNLNNVIESTNTLIGGDAQDLEALTLSIEEIKEDILEIQTELSGNDTPPTDTGN